MRKTYVFTNNNNIGVTRTFNIIIVNLNIIKDFNIYTLFRFKYNILCTEQTENRKKKIWMFMYNKHESVNYILNKFNALSYRHYLVWLKL